MSFFPERRLLGVIFFFFFVEINTGFGALAGVKGVEGWEFPFACEMWILGEFVACLFPVGNSFCKGSVMGQVCFGVVIDCGGGVFVLGDVLVVLVCCVGLFGEFIQVWGEDNVLFEFVDVDGAGGILNVIVGGSGSIGGISWVGP